MTGDSAMAEHIPGDPDAGSWFVRFDDGDMHLVQDGEPGAPAVLLIHGTAASTAPWDPVATIRKGLSSAFTRQIDIPDALIEATLGMTHRAVAGTSRGSDDYLRRGPADPVESLPQASVWLGACDPVTP